MDRERAVYQVASVHFLDLDCLNTVLMKYII